MWHLVLQISRISIYTLSIMWFFVGNCIAGGPENPLVQFGGGVLATVVQSTVMVPVEVIRQRQMIQTAGEGSYTVCIFNTVLV